MLTESSYWLAACLNFEDLNNLKCQLFWVAVLLMKMVFSTQRKLLQVHRPNNDGSASHWGLGTLGEHGWGWIAFPATTHLAQGWPGQKETCLGLPEAALHNPSHRIKIQTGFPLQHHGPTLPFGSAWRSLFLSHTNQN